MKRLLPFLLVALPVSGQTITTQPTNQTVLAPSTASFTVVASASCRSLWTVNGVGHFGATASVLTYTIPSTSPDYRTGTTVQVQLFGCTGSTAKLLSAKVTLTVNNLNVNLNVANDDGSFPAVTLTIAVVNADNSQSPVLTLTTNAQGIASGGFLYSPANMYSISATLNGQLMFPPELFSGALFSLIYPNAATVSASFVLKAGQATLVSSDVKVN